MCEVGRWLRACDIIFLNSTGKELGMWLLRYSVLAPPPSIWTWLLERGKSVRIHWWWRSHPIRLFSKALLQFFWRSKVKTRGNSLQCGSGKKYLVCPLHLKTQIPWKLDAWIDNVLQGHWDLSWVSTLSYLPFLRCLFSIFKYSQDFSLWCCLSDTCTWLLEDPVVCSSFRNVQDALKSTTSLGTLDLCCQLNSASLSTYLQELGPPQGHHLYKQEEDITRILEGFTCARQTGTWLHTGHKTASLETFSF